VELALVMPAYNEAECIDGVVRSWLPVLDRVGSGILIVVNDGSTDPTGDQLNRLAASDARIQVIHQQNSGHGAAVLRGYREALASGAGWIFQVDSDGQLLAQDFWLLWEARHDSPFLLGRRARRNDPLYRLAISRLVRALNFLLFRVSVRDANIPFRLLRSDFLAALLELVPSGVFAPNLFLSVLAARSGARLGEFPVTHLERGAGTSKILRLKLLKACFRSALELLRFSLDLGRPAQAAKLENLRKRYVTRPAA
jgi:dolichol-phosphate mannosyltransferase